MKRNKVWWADLPPPSGPRRVVILTRDAVVNALEGIVLALVTRTDLGLPSEVRLGRREGLRGPCVVSLDNFVTVRKARLTRRLGALSEEKVDELNRTIKLALDIRD